MSLMKTHHILTADAFEAVLRGKVWKDGLLGKPSVEVALHVTVYQFHIKGG